MSSRKVLLLIVLIVVVAAAGLWLYRTRKPEPHRAVVPVGTPVQIAVPLGLPPVPVPADNPPTAETIALGRRIYYDPILSVDNTISCATCHHPDFGFTDGKQFSEGVNGQLGGRNAPPSSTPPTSPPSSGMDASPAWKNRPKARYKTRWRWPTRWKQWKKQ